MTIGDPSYNLVSQLAHFFAGLAICLLGLVFYGMIGLSVASGGMIVYASIKEFWYDMRFETPGARGSSAEDFFFYVLGILTAWGAIGLSTGWRPWN